MKCEACGIEYATGHRCPANMSPETRRIVLEGLHSPEDAGIGYYLREIRKMLHCDSESILRIAHDPRATNYGLVLFALAIAVLVIVPKITNLKPQSVPIPIGIYPSLMYGIAGVIGISILQVVVCFVISKWFLEGKGTFIEVARPLMLVWFVNCFVLFSHWGLEVTVLWTLAMIVVFSEVMKIRAVWAYFMIATVNFAVFAFYFSRLPVKHHL
jgi:hypothetical protein